MNKESKRQLIRKIVYNALFTKLFNESENKAIFDLITKTFRCNVITYSWYKVL